MTSYKKDVQPPIFLVCVKMIEKIFKIGWLSNLKIVLIPTIRHCKRIKIFQLEHVWGELSYYLLTAV